VSIAATSASPADSSGEREPGPPPNWAATATWTNEIFERAGCSNPNDDEHFFPGGFLFPADRRNDADDFVREWWSSSLQRMEEPSLSCDGVGVEGYRLLVVPTWGPALAIRIGALRARTRLSVALLNGQGGYDQGHLERLSSRELFAAERRKIVRAIHDAGFWNMPTVDYERRGFDGTEYILEGRSGDRYRVVHRWSPESGTFHDLCRSFMRVAGM
jgi:hypothetical protein